MEKKHIPPTARQKVRIYKRVKKTLTIDTEGKRCICDCMQDAQHVLRYSRLSDIGLRWKVSGDSGDGNCLKVNFPELYKRKPFFAIRDKFWWSVGTAEGFNKRLMVLDEMIYELQCEIEEEKLQQVLNKNEQIFN